MHFKPASVDSIMLYLGEIISEEILEQVQTTYHQLQGMHGIIEMTPSYNSIWIHYDLQIHNHQNIKERIKERLQKQRDQAPKQKPKLIEIPVTYNGADLERVAGYNHLTIDEVIILHRTQSYRVYAIGFMVGFAYLAQVDPLIATPRLATPRAKVPKGSVAIADRQTAIYPQDSAGGWNIIGETTFDDFEVFEIGDWVRFIN